jgi:hypothetical protein
MKLLEFNYTKADGSVSDRAVIELVSPTQFVEGIDVTQMPEDEFALFADEMRNLKNAQHEATMALLAKHDLKHNYRRFSPDKMSNLNTEYV